MSVRRDHVEFFGGVRTVVVDEIHSFGGDDRGWHLLAVLERLSGGRRPGHPAHWAVCDGWGA